MKQRWRRFWQIGWQIDMLNGDEIDTVSRELRCLVDTELTYCKSSTLRRLNPKSIDRRVITVFISQSLSRISRETLYAD